jgi:hypothetical protein
VGYNVSECRAPHIVKCPCCTSPAVFKSAFLHPGIYQWYRDDVVLNRLTRCRPNLRVSFLVVQRSLRKHRHHIMRMRVARVMEYASCVSRECGRFLFVRRSKCSKVVVVPYLYYVQIQNRKK